jgi:hypothetical protein
VRRQAEKGRDRFAERKSTLTTGRIDQSTIRAREGVHTFFPNPDLMEAPMTYRVSLVNGDGVRLTLWVRCAIERDAAGLGEAQANADPEHCRFGPWRCRHTIRDDC